MNTHCKICGRKFYEQDACGRWDCEPLSGDDRYCMTCAIEACEQRQLTKALLQAAETPPPTVTRTEIDEDKCLSCKFESLTIRDVPCKTCGESGVDYSNYVPRMTAETTSTEQTCKNCGNARNVNRAPYECCIHSPFCGDNWRPK